MSDNWILIVPKLPEQVPSPENAQAALEFFKELAPGADEIEIVQSEHVQFFDCGTNLETISCPRCSAHIELDWWGAAMSSDYDESEGFRLSEFQLPCCSTFASLDALVYEFHQVFGRFALSAMNPNLGLLSDDTIRSFETTLACDISVVYQHI
ncbi:hypothetical protein [Pseudophaeobacter sp. EL27]|uniref:hypothetical protein n=1 Tax=Pseudophaeobacter sp. EL27 TaxID=2107580 RepID=UPI0013C4754F|nr:hypothetical protein [Pseudophaeobacter sp. EL27]